MVAEARMNLSTSCSLPLFCPLIMRVDLSKVDNPLGQSNSLEISNIIKHGMKNKKDMDHINFIKLLFFLNFLDIPTLLISVSFLEMHA